MRLLFLGNSNDAVQWFDQGPKRHELLRDMLAAEFNEPVEVIARGIWPTSGMPAAVGRWLDEYHPDVVYLNVVSFWFQYESVPLRVKRILGRLGPAVGDAGFKLAESKRWSHNAVFRSVRRLAQATIGGDTHFTPDEVIERISETIRIVLRNEGVLLVVKGPRAITRHGVTRRQQRRNEARRLKIHHSLKRLCEQLHVFYDGSEAPLYETAPRPRGTRVGDGLHSNARGHANSAEETFELIRKALDLHREGAGAVAASSER